MQDRLRYQEAVHCLATHGYEVYADGAGYIVRHRDDRGDISKARHLDDLVELSELFDWAAQRKSRLANIQMNKQVDSVP
jgi:hypothetical protein